jgi:hypothetical protein
MQRARSVGKCATSLALGAGALILASSANASLITFDPDGAAAGNAPQVIGSLDWAVGNALATPRPTSVGQTYQVYYHATLGSMINSAGTPVTPAGLNSTFEITAVAGYTYVCTSITNTGGGTATNFILAPVQSPNSFFEIWYDSAPNANSLAGTGFNDGTRIMLGLPNAGSPNVGNYSGTGFIETFDQFGPNNYGISSQIGAGAISNNNSISGFDPSFFLSSISTMAFNTSLVTAFHEQDPSNLFTTVAGGVPPTYVPVRGTINGTGPDMQYQSDGSVAFTVIPEPTMLGAVGLSMLTLVSRRRRA